MQSCSVIAKGSYSDFRFNDFVSVRQYLLIREKGRKYLILKLLNQGAETVTALKLVVEQIDVRGKSIATSRVEWSGLQGKAGEAFVPQDKIPLKENCMEVKINLVGAVYGDYTYSVKSNQLVVTYDKKPCVNDKDYSQHTGGQKIVLSERKFKSPRSLVVVAIAVMIMAIAGTTLQLSFFKKNQSDFVWRGVSYEFATESKEEGAPIRAVDCTGLTGNIVIPKDIKGYPVTEIAQKAFYKKSSLRSIRIEAEVPIWEKAFEGCDNLKTAQLIGVTSIGDGAFYSCDSLESVTACNLQSIGSQAFSDCKNLSSINISNNDVQLAIGDGAFLGCYNVKTIVLDQNVQYLSNTDIFSGVTKVQELTLKNYNSEAFEDSTDKGLEDLFCGAKQTELVKLTIKDIDAFPASFCEDLKMLQSVTLGGLKTDTIPNSAFSGCEKLTELNIDMEEDAAITTVGDYAFFKTAISSFDGSAFVSVGKYAFAENGNLTSVSSSQNLAALGEGAFKGCGALSSFDIGALLLRIEDRTFEECYSLTSVTIDSSSELISIGNSAFLDCKSLVNIKMPNTVVSIGEKAYKNCEAATMLTISRGVLTIGKYAFSGCISIKNVEIPITAAEIGKGAFKSCTALESITAPFVGCSPTQDRYFAAIFDGVSYYDSTVVPESLKKVTITGDYDVDYGAFYGLKHIKQVYFTGDFCEIGYDAFVNCSNLRELRLSPSLTTIGANAFENCYLLFEVYNDSSLNITRGGNDFGGVGLYALAVYGKNSTRLEQTQKDGFTFLKAPEGWYLTDYVDVGDNWVLPRSFTANSGEATSYVMVAHLFEQRNDVKELTVTSGVSSLGERAFYGCGQLQKVTFSGDVLLSSIPKHAFANVYELRTVLLEGDCNVQSIDEGAFYYCIMLDSVDIGKNVKSIGQYAFSGCSSVTHLYLGANIERIGFGALSGMTALTELTVPFIGESKTTNSYMGYVLGQNPEGGHSSTQLKKITVLYSPTVGQRAFYGFQYLEEINLAPDTSEIGDYAFAYCYSINSFNFSGLTRIGEYAFYYTGIKGVALPTRLVSLGVGAFGYSAIQSLTMRYSNLTVIPYAAFTNCSELSSVDMTGSCVESIEAYAFYNTGVKQIAFSQNVKTIGESAFYDTRLTSLTIGGSIASIGDNAFAYCQSLKSVVITSMALTHIPEGAFRQCALLSEVTFADGLKEIGESAFEGTPIVEIILPSSLTTVRAYAFASCWLLGCVRLSANMEIIETGAFAGCNELYEVYNPSNLTITRGGENHGFIAYNAIIVHKSLSATKLQTATVQGLVFKYAPTEGEACLFSHEGIITELNFESVNLGGRIYSRYWIYANAFIGNLDLVEVNTGSAIQEIGETAFAYCTGLRKVTIGSGLMSGKVAQYAFFECTSLWEVNDSNTNYVITKGDTGCGHVAYYAVAINQAITYKTQGAFEFMCVGGAWCLYAYNGSTSVALPQTDFSYSIFKHEKLSSGPFGSLQYKSYLIIPTAVNKIYPNAFGSSQPIIYYLGTQSEWAAITAGTSLSLSVYYYSQCVHNSYKGYMHWTYQNGEPSLSDTHLLTTTVNATCKDEGLVTKKCETCKEILSTEVYSKVNHNFNDKGKCGWCGQASVQSGDLGDLVSVTNASVFKYLIDGNNIYSDWSSGYGNFSSDMVIRALSNVRIEFTVRCVLPSGASCGVYLNGSRLCWFESDDSVRLSCDLAVNEFLNFEIRSYARNGEARIFIDNIVITKIEE